LGEILLEKERRRDEVWRSEKGEGVGNLDLC
jgi:hypothetical protein